MMNVPVKWVDDDFEMNDVTVVKRASCIPVFEEKVDNSIVLHDQNKDLIAQEKQVVSVDGVNGPFISLGSMEEVKTTGNWPQIYDSPTEN